MLAKAAGAGRCSARRLSRRSRRLLAALALAVPAAAVPAAVSAHTGPPPTPSTVLATWSPDRPLLAALALTALIYGTGLRRLWRQAGRGRGVEPWRAVSFAAGMLTLAAALLSPLDGLSSALFSAHMAQHLLLLAVAPPLLVLGLPQLVAFWALPHPSRRRLGGWWLRHRAARAAWRGVSHPVSVWLLAAAALWIWHLPPLFDAALRSEPVHAAEHLCFVLTASLFWWTALQPRGRRRLSAALATPYIIAMALQSTVLGVLLTVSAAPWYAYSSATAAWGLTPNQDQQIAGLVMWIPGGVIYLAAACALFVSWLEQGETATRGANDDEPGVAAEPT
ncbi:MAG TPA: cytochrome c oxidase assembly protein [Dehalococcoidia bacterium]|nr:cytochrome c oxidase assembly protein [Dehalococcoidia bacterium]